MRSLSSMTAIALVFLLAAPASADQRSADQRSDGSQPSAREQKKERKKDRRQKRRPSRRKLKGAVQEFGEITVRGDSEKHLFVLIRLRNGTRAVADLGPISDFEGDARPKRGETIEVEGDEILVNERPVLVVHTFTIDGLTRDTRNGPRSLERRSERRLQPEPRDQRRSAADRPRARRRGSRVLAGRVAAMQDVRLAGTDHRHRLVKLRTRSGRTIVADLGRREALRDLKLQKGDSLVVFGTPRRVDGKPVMLAHRVGEFVRVRRAPRARAERSLQTGFQRGPEDRRPQGFRDFRTRPTRRPNTVILQGEIEDFKEVDVSGFADRQTLVKLRLANDRTAVVNFGTRVDLADLGLDEGDRVTIRGRKMRVSGKPLIQAEKLRVTQRLRPERERPRRDRFPRRSETY